MRLDGADQWRRGGSASIQGTKFLCYIENSGHSFLIGNVVARGGLIIQDSPQHPQHDPNLQGGGTERGQGRGQIPSVTKCPRGTARAPAPRTSVTV